MTDGIEAPPADDLDNVVLTPHIASASGDVIERHTEMTVADVEALVAGERPMHVVNPETLDSFEIQPRKPKLEL